MKFVHPREETLRQKVKQAKCRFVRTMVFENSHWVRVTDLVGSICCKAVLCSVECQATAPNNSLFADRQVFNVRNILELCETLVLVRSCRVTLNQMRVKGSKFAACLIPETEEQTHRPKSKSADPQSSCRAHCRGRCGNVHGVVSSFRRQKRSTSDLARSSTRHQWRNAAGKENHFSLILRSHYQMWLYLVTSKHRRLSQ